ncbi:MAG: hypothetical protein ACFFD4_10405 [Candidatus Odinarchaeota archaeon]
MIFSPKSTIQEEKPVTHKELIKRVKYLYDSVDGLVVKNAHLTRQKLTGRVIAEYLDETRSVLPVD